MCDADEEVTAVTSSSTLPVSTTGQQQSCFIVGSVRHQLGEPEPSHGKVMVFTVHDAKGSSESTLRPIVSTETKGCVYAIAVVDQFVIAAVNSAVSKAGFCSSETFLRSAHDRSSCINSRRFQIQRRLHWNKSANGITTTLLQIWSPVTDSSLLAMQSALYRYSRSKIPSWWP